MSPDTPPEGEESEKKNPRTTIEWWLKWIPAAKRYKPRERWCEDSLAGWRQYDYNFPEDAKRENGACTHGYPIYKHCSDKLYAALFAQLPKCRSRRKHGIDDPMALTMALINDRLGDHLIEDGNLSETMLAAKGDFVHTGKATTQVMYTTETQKYRMPLQMQMVEGGEPLYYETSPEEPYDGPVFQEGDAYFGEGERAIDHTQKITAAPVLFDEILHTPEAKTQAEITEIAYKFCIDYEKAEQLFNTNPDGTSKGLTLPYKQSKAYGGDDEKKVTEEAFDMPGKILEGWECYCLHTRSKYWVCEGYKDGFLMTEADPEGLRKFFPSPSFIIQNKSRKHMFPTPIWVYLEGTANQLNKLYERIFGLIDSIRRRCLVYGASTELIEALNGADQEYISAGELMDLLDNGGINNLIHWVPVEQLVAALTESMELEDHFKTNFFEWFNLPEILRGTSDPNQTATAMELQSGEAHDTLKYMREQLKELARETVELMLDYAYKVYSRDKIARIVGWEYFPKGDPGRPEVPPGPPSPENPEGTPGEPEVPPTPGHYERFDEALERLRNDEERFIRIDFETDSTTFKDEQRNFNKAKLISDTVLNGMSIISRIENTQNYDIAVTQLLSVLESMGGSSQTEDMVKKATSDLEKAKANPPPTPPDHEATKLQLQAQKNQTDAMAKQQQLDQQGAKIQIENMKASAKAQLDQLQAASDARNEQILIALEQQKVQLDAQRVLLEAKTVEIDGYRAQLQGIESMLEEVRLRLEANAEIVSQATSAASEIAPALSPPKVEVNIDVPSGNNF